MRRGPRPSPQVDRSWYSHKSQDGKAYGGAARRPESAVHWPVVRVPAWRRGPTALRPAPRRAGDDEEWARGPAAQEWRRWGPSPAALGRGSTPVDRTEDSPTWPATCKVPALSRSVTTGEHRPGTAHLLSSEVNRDSPGHAVGPPTDPHGPRPDAGRLQGPGTDTGVQVRRNELCPTAPARWRTGRSWRSANRRVDTHTTEGR